MRSLRNYTQQAVAQPVQVGLLAQSDGECGECLGCVVLPSIEAPIYESLDAASEGHEQRRDHEGGAHYDELGLLHVFVEERNIASVSGTPPKQTMTSITVRTP